MVFLLLWVVIDLENSNYPLSPLHPHASTGLEISTRKLAKCEWFFEVASLKNILQQTFASQVPSFASKKNLTSKTLLVDKKVKFEPCSMHILPTVCYTFPMVLTRRIC